MGFFDVSAERVRERLGRSARWQSLTSELDFRAISKAPVLQIENWTQQELVAVLDWVNYPNIPLPAVLDAYVKSVKGQDKCLPR